MRYLKTLGLAFAAVLAVGAVSAGSASAAPQWLLNNEAVKETMPVKSKGLLELTDSKGGAFGGSVTVHCTGTDEGTVGANGLDLVTKITVISCVHASGETCEKAEASPLHLPWHTQLEEPKAGEIRDKISNDGAGEPGWSVKCTAFGVTSTDECTGSLTTLMKNAAPNVVAEFQGAASGKANCSRGGAGAGTVLGSNTIEDPTAGSTIAVK